MAKSVHYCRCRVNLAGQNCHTVIFDEFSPLSWPEVQVLIALHGEENVMDIMPVAIGEVWPSGEKNRLASIYGTRVVEACFPGRNFRMEYMMTDTTDLPWYGEHLMAEPPKTPDDDRPKPPPPKPPPPDTPGDDHDDGEDEDAAIKTTPALDPIFKPGRNRPPAQKEA